MDIIKQGEITMINELFEQATKTAGNQTKLAKKLGITQGRLSEFKNYKIGDKRKPSEEVILQIADVLGLDKGETLYKAKLELEPEKAYLWKWCARRESNPRPSASETFTNLVRYILSLSVVFPSVVQPYRHRLNHGAI